MPYTMYPDGSPGSAITLHHVTGDNADYTQEETVHNLLGRGRKVDRGTDYGRTRTINCTLYENGIETVATQLSNIQALRTPGCDAIRLDDPFGDSMLCSITGLSRSRVNAGTDDYMTLSITLTEVA